MQSSPRKARTSLVASHSGGILPVKFCATSMPRPHGCPAATPSVAGYSGRAGRGRFVSAASVCCCLAAARTAPRWRNRRSNAAATSSSASWRAESPHAARCRRAANRRPGAVGRRPDLRRHRPSSRPHRTSIPDRRNRNRRLERCREQAALLDGNAVRIMARLGGVPLAAVMPATSTRRCCRMTSPPSSPTSRTVKPIRNGFGIPSTKAPARRDPIPTARLVSTKPCLADPAKHGAYLVTIGYCM